MIFFAEIVPLFCSFALGILVTILAQNFYRFRAYRALERIDISLFAAQRQLRPPRFFESNSRALVRLNIELYSKRVEQKPAGLDSGAALRQVAQKRSN